MIGEHDTIVAPATASGGAIAIVRASGSDAINICDKVFRSSKSLTEAAANSILYGNIIDGNNIIDDVLVSVFRAPHSYTGEDSIEISCHGSQYIVSEILALLLRSGARMADAGEFTIRAFLAGKIDLAQAEAVADLIASSTQASHAMASTQMRGGYSDELTHLRDKLLRLTALLELELDFSEEDVEFANRNELRDTMVEIDSRIEKLRNSFALGNVIKEGVAVAIVGEPNVGKSTLLNRLLNEERAMVSEIAGTTRDTIEATTNIDGVLFRFIDTAGIHATDDKLEKMGIERTYSTIDKAHIVIQLLDAADLEKKAVPVVGVNDNSALSDAADLVEDATLLLRSDQKLIVAINKIDTRSTDPVFQADKMNAESIIQNDSIDADCVLQRDPICISAKTGLEIERLRKTLRSTIDTESVIQNDSIDADCVLQRDPICISAKIGLGIERLRKTLRSTIDTESIYHGDITVSNRRHYAALTSAHTALERALISLDDGTTNDLLSEDIHEIIYHIGTITGEITSDEVLGTIFSKFCIGK